MNARSICFVGFENLPVLAPEYRQHLMGGAQMQQTLLAKALVRRGWKVSMVVADYGQEDGACWDGIVTHRAYRFDAGIPVLRFVHPRWTYAWAAMRRANADIYYVSSAGPQLGMAAAFAGRHHRKLVFRIAHDTDCQPDKLLIRYWRDKVLYKFGIRHSDLILAQSNKQQSLMQRHFQLQSKVIPSLVGRTDVFKPRAQRSIDVLWISNIRQFKRPDLALEFARQEPGIKLHMIGGADPGALPYYEEIRSRAAQLPNVVFHGHQPVETVNERLTEAGVLINTSDSEGFPNTYIQAWARGTPVVTLFDPDDVVARERLGGGAQNLSDMRAAVTQLLTNHDYWNEVSVRCRAYVNARHGEPALDAYEATLTAVLAGAG
jgi:glycosyltransferase involved in cell wall biosynthesis